MLATVTVSDWVALLAALGTVLAAVGGIIAALHGVSINRQLKVPSNNVTIGAVAEGIAQVQHMLVGIAHPDVNVPAATDVARALVTGTPTPQPTPAPLVIPQSPPPQPPAPPTP